MEAEATAEGGGGDADCLVNLSLRQIVEGDWKAAAKCVDYIETELGNSGDLETIRNSRKYPISISESQSIVQAREEAEERKQARKAIGKAHGKDKENIDISVGNSIMKRADICPWDRKDKTVFWLYCEVRHKLQF